MLGWGSKIVCAARGFATVTRNVQRHLALLACALGPLATEELSEVAARAHGVEPSPRIKDVLHPIRRFVIGTGRRTGEDGGGYVLAHPKLGDYLRDEYFDNTLIGKTQLAFADWGREVVRNLNAGKLAPSNVPPYLLQFYSKHLERMRAPAPDFMALVEEGWLKAWVAFEGSYTGFTSDVTTAREILLIVSVPHEPFFSWRARCQLVLCSLFSIGSYIGTELLGAGVRHGCISPRNAIKQIKEFKSDEPKAKALELIADLLPISMLPQALEVAREISVSYHRALTLAVLAHRLDDGKFLAVMEEVFELTNGENHIEDTTLILTGILQRCDQKRGHNFVKSAMTTLEQFNISDLSLEACLGLARFVSGDKSEELPCKIFELLETEEDRHSLSKTVADIAYLLTPFWHEYALSLVCKIVDHTARLYALSHLADHIAPNYRGILVEATLRGIEKETHRKVALGRISNAIPLSDRQKVVRAAIDACGQLVEDDLEADDIIDLLRHVEPNDQDYVVGVALDRIEKESYGFARAGMLY